jgi:hypothetical protein
VCYFHRAATIDFHIELRLFAEQHDLTVEFFHSYFDSTGANRSEHPEDRLQRLSKMPLEEGFFIPDGIFAVHAPDGSRYLYALEVYNGMDTKRVHGQMEKHLIALGEGHLSELYHYPKAHRVLCLFESANALQAAEKRLREDPAFTEQMQRQFALSTLAGVREDFAGNWLFLERGRTTIFDTPSQPVKPQPKIRQFFERLGV